MTIGFNFYPHLDLDSMMTETLELFRREEMIEP